MPNSAVLPLPTQDELRRLFTYMPDSGALIWNARPLSDFKTKRAQAIWNTKYANRRAGFMFRGYRKVGLFNKDFAAHRIIWAIANGPIPDEMRIDHINGLSGDNRLENLRLVTPAGNSRNQKLHASNTSGFCGVHWVSSIKRWSATGTVNGVKSYLGMFHTKEEAHKAARAFRTANGFSGRHGSLTNHSNELDGEKTA